MEDIVNRVAECERRGEAVALASLVESSGSIPMSERAKMVVKSDGAVLGTIGGGCLEAEIINCCREVLETGRAQTTRYTMTEKQAGETGLNCGGSVFVYTERVGVPGDSDVYDAVSTAKADRQPCVLATLMSTERLEASGAGRVLYFADGARCGSLGDEELDAVVEKHAAEMVETEKAKVLRFDGDSMSLCGDGVVPDSGGASKAGGVVNAASRIEVFVQPFLPPPVLFVFGGGHVGAQIGKLATEVGFRVLVIDDRPMFSNAERHPYAAGCIVDEMDNAFRELEIDDQSFIVAATRGHQHDEIVVEQAIRTSARYIGMLGSERKKMILWKRIADRGGDSSQLDRVYAPIGLNIGADNPEEIAVSVVAELIKVRRGSRKKWKTKRTEAVG